MLVKQTSYLQLNQNQPNLTFRSISYESHAHFKNISIYTVLEILSQAQNDTQYDRIPSPPRVHRSMSQKAKTPLQFTNEKKSSKEQQNIISNNNSPSLTSQRQIKQQCFNQHKKDLTYTVAELQTQVKRMAQLNQKILLQLDIKERELKQYKQKLNNILNNSNNNTQSSTVMELQKKLELLEKEKEQLELNIQELEERQQEMEREHNREISELKSNLQNSIIEDDDGIVIKQQQKQQRQNEGVWSFAVQQAPENEQMKILNQYQEDTLSTSINTVQQQVKHLQEENQIYRSQLKLIQSQIEGTEHPELISSLQSYQQRLIELFNDGLNLRVKHLERENTELQNKLSFGDIEQNEPLQQLLSQFDDYDRVEKIPQKIIRLLHQLQDLELELEEWKRNYWILEKKVTNMEQNQTQESTEILPQLNYSQKIKYDQEIASLHNMLKQEQEKNKTLNEQMKTKKSNDISDSQKKSQYKRIIDQIMQNQTHRLQQTYQRVSPINLHRNTIHSPQSKVVQALCRHQYPQTFTLQNINQKQ